MIVKSLKNKKTVWVKLNSRVWRFDSLLCFDFFSRTFVEDRCLFLAFPRGWWRVSAHVKERKEKSLSRVQLFATPWTVAYQAFPSMGFSKQEFWSGLPFPSPGDLPDPRIESGSPAMEADALTSEPPGNRRKAHVHIGTAFSVVVTKNGHKAVAFLMRHTFAGGSRQWHPTPVLLPGKSHGRRSLVGCSPWGRWGLDTT